MKKAFLPLLMAILILPACTMHYKDTGINYSIEYYPAENRFAAYHAIYDYEEDRVIPNENVQMNGQAPDGFQNNYKYYWLRDTIMDLSFMLTYKHNVFKNDVRYSEIHDRMFIIPDTISVSSGFMLRWERLHTTDTFTARSIYMNGLAITGTDSMFIPASVMKDYIADKDLDEGYDTLHIQNKVIRFSEKNRWRTRTELIEIDMHKYYYTK